VGGAGWRGGGGWRSALSLGRALALPISPLRACSLSLTTSSAAAAATAAAAVNTPPLSPPPDCWQPPAHKKTARPTRLRSRIRPCSPFSRFPRARVCAQLSPLAFAPVCVRVVVVAASSSSSSSSRQQQQQQQLASSRHGLSGKRSPHSPTLPTLLPRPRLLFPVTPFPRTPLPRTR
jgi:hypothetical protein